MTERSVGSDHLAAVAVLLREASALAGGADLGAAELGYGRALAMLDAHRRDTDDDAVDQTELDIRAGLGEVLAARGDHAGSRAQFERALALYQQRGAKLATFPAEVLHDGLARALVALGALPAALESYQRAIDAEVAEPSAVPYLLSLAALARGKHLLAHGAPEAAQALFAQAIGFIEADPGSALFVDPSLEDVAATLHEHGRLDAALAYYERLRAMRAAEGGADALSRSDPELDAAIGVGAIDRILAGLRDQLASASRTPG